jgi:hypothetical protein
MALEQRKICLSHDAVNSFCDWPNGTDKDLSAGISRFITDYQQLSTAYATKEGQLREGQVQIAILKTALETITAYNETFI